MFIFIQKSLMNLEITKMNVYSFKMNVFVSANERLVLFIFVVYFLLTNSKRCNLTSADEGFYSKIVITKLFL